MLVEKLKYLQHHGAVHFFRIDTSNFLYSRENNHTYQIDDDIYNCLTTELISNPNALDAIDQLFNQIKIDVKPKVNLFTLFVSDPSKITNYGTRIKESCFAYAQGEIFFNDARAGYSEDTIIEFMSHLKEIGRSDLVFVHEKNISSTIENTNSNALENDMSKFIFYVDSLTQHNIPDIKQINSQIKFEYTLEREIDLQQFIEGNDNYVSLYIENDVESQSFTNFLLFILNNEHSVSNKIYNFYLIANALLSKVVLEHTIENYNDGVFMDVSNATCDKCWAKNVCWATKSFHFFNINLSNIVQYSSQCNAIKNIVERIILILRMNEIENRPRTKNDTFDFDGAEIKLIN